MGRQISLPSNLPQPEKSLFLTIKAINQYMVAEKPSSRKRSIGKETARKISEAAKKKWRTPEFRAKMSAAMQRPEERARKSAAMKAIRQRQEAGRLEDVAWRMNQVFGLRLKNLAIEEIAKRVGVSREAVRNDIKRLAESVGPETAKRLAELLPEIVSARRREVMQRPELKARLREAQQAAWQRPGHRERMMQIGKAQAYRPDLTPEEEARAYRMNKVFGLRLQNKSAKEIADQLGVGQTAAHRDIKRLMESVGPETAQRLAALPPEIRREKMIAIWGRPGYRGRMLRKRREVWQRPEYRERQSRVQKEVHQRPEYRERQSEAQRAAWERPGAKESRGRVSKEIWERPGFRERWSMASTRPIPKLTPAQEKLRQSMMPIIQRYLKRFRYAYRLRPEFFEDIRLEAGLRSYHAAVDYRPMASLSTFLLHRVKGWVRNALRAKLKEELGLRTFGETDRLVSLLTHMDRGKPVGQIARERGITKTEATEWKLEQVAIKRRIPLGEARELWQAYRTKRREIPFDLLRQER